MAVYDGDEDVDIISVEDGDLDLEGAMDEALGAVEAREHGAEESELRSESESEPDDSVAALEAEIGRLREQNLRALAELENYRKRVARERAEERRYAGQDTLREILDVKDNLVRAMESRGATQDLKAGVEMTLRQLDQVLERAGISPVEALGERFDPAVHEAVQRLEQDGVEEPAVMEVMQRGYRLHDRLLRPARVVVAVPAESNTSSLEDE